MDRLHLEVYCNPTSSFAEFVEDVVNFLHMYIGGVREAVAHSSTPGQQGKVIYNESAWDKEHFTEMQDAILRRDHKEVIRELVTRINEQGVPRVDLGFLGRWKNAYQLADNVLPSGISFSLEKSDDTFLFRGTFFSPENWFALQCKPLFKTDAIVEKDPKGAWNMNAVGLIGPKPEKVSANRRALFMMLADFSREFDPLFLGLSYSNFYFNPRTSVAYIVDPAAKSNDLLMPLVFYFHSGGRVLYSDSTDIPHDRFGSFLARDRKVSFEKKHFDFL